MIIKPYIKTLSLLLVLSASGVGVAANAEENNSVVRDHMVVIVQEGDTLSEIVRRKMLTARHWPEVAKYNKIRDVFNLNVGQPIYFPHHLIRDVDQSAEVLFAKGKAELISASEYGRQQLVRGTKLYIGDDIETGATGFVSLKFSSGSVLNVQPQSYITLKDIDCSEAATICVIDLKVDSGASKARVKSRSNQPVKFNLQTPNGAAAVRGTSFDLATSSDASLMGVLSGEVEFIADGDSVNVTKGLGVVTRSGEGPGVPSALLDQPVFFEIPARLAVNDIIQWREDSEAVSYIVTISEDEAQNKVVLSQSIDLPAYKVGFKGAGDFFLSVRAVDKVGLKGLMVIHPIKIVDVRESVQEVVLEKDLLRGEIGLTVQDSSPDAAKYEIQLSAFADFTSYVSVDILPGQGVQQKLTAEQDYYARARAILDERTVTQFGPHIKLLAN